MTIAEIVRRGSGRAGHAGSWRVERLDSDPFVGREYALYHYGTLMLKWRRSKRFGDELLFAGTGHGSVSDQNGINTAFKVLNLDYYFSRKGGPDILDCYPGTRIPIRA